MFVPREYELLDFGGGRKLERFGPIVLDRPAPAASGVQPSRPELWSEAAARFEMLPARSSGGKQSTAQRGRWTTFGELPVTWTVCHQKIHFELKLTPFGHVGIFPEQAANWDWIAAQPHATPLQILNLFAYTGGSTLAAAAVGAKVTHVDAARNMVAWARRNAELSGLSAAPIRWIVDDALKFSRRELKRGNRYDAVILDPPSYGHGASGETWILEDDLPELLEMCRELTGPQLRFLLLTCHAPNYDARRLAQCLVTAGFAQNLQQIESGNLSLSSTDGLNLTAGAFARAIAT
ncbi:MAG TPA: class I SAM-dependent methyltransferase [Pirellulales bacterium]|nr:class I SAM-dependent methyltransferase [Pirellulales bacterium]